MPFRLGAFAFEEGSGLSQCTSKVTLRVSLSIFNPIFPIGLFGSFWAENYSRRHARRTGAAEPFAHRIRAGNTSSRITPIARTIALASYSL